MAADAPDLLLGEHHQMDVAQNLLSAAGREDAITPLPGLGQVAIFGRRRHRHRAGQMHQIELHLNALFLRQQMHLPHLLRGVGGVQLGAFVEIMQGRATNVDHDIFPK